MLEQLPIRAHEKSWNVIDVNAENALQSLVNQLSRIEEGLTLGSPKVEVTPLGFGGSVVASVPKEKSSYTVDDLDVLLIEACKKAQYGIFVKHRRDSENAA